MGSTMIDHSSVRVLVVDDDDISCKVLSAMLNCHGYKSQCVSNGQDCINAMKSGQFDLILIDWIMPVIDGRETVSLIRNGTAGDHYKEIPIIAVTADLIMSPRDTCIQAGADECLYKPIDFKELIATLESELATKGNSSKEIAANDVINIAKTDHRKFVDSIMHDFVGEQPIQSKSIPDHTSCSFGKWLRSHRVSVYGNSPEFIEISEIHVRIHLLTDEALELLNHGDRAQANRVVCEIEAISQNMVILLDKLTNRHVDVSTE